MKKVSKAERNLLRALRKYPVLVHKNFCLFHAGERGTDYFDIDRMACSSSLQKDLVARFVEAIKSLEKKGMRYNKIAFIDKETGPTGIIVLASMFSQRLRRDIVILRPWQKLRFEHVKIKGCIESRDEYALGPNDLVLLVDDVITTGGTQKEAIDLVVRFHAKVTGIVCALVRKAEAVRSIKEEKGIEFIDAIWTYDELTTLGYGFLLAQNLLKGKLAYGLAYEALPKNEARKAAKALDEDISEVVAKLLKERHIEADNSIKEGLKNLYLNSIMNLLQHSERK